MHNHLENASSILLYIYIFIYIFMIIYSDKGNPPRDNSINSLDSLDPVSCTL